MSLFPRPTLSWWRCYHRTPHCCSVAAWKRKKHTAHSHRALVFLYRVGCMGSVVCCIRCGATGQAPTQRCAPKFVQQWSLTCRNIQCLRGPSRTGRNEIFVDHFCRLHVKKNNRGVACSMVIHRMATFSHPHQTDGMYQRNQERGATCACFGEPWKTRPVCRAGWAVPSRNPVRSLAPVHSIT